MLIILHCVISCFLGNQAYRVAMSCYTLFLLTFDNMSDDCVIIGSGTGNGLLPLEIPCQAITRANAGLLSAGSHGNKSQWNFNQNRKISFKKCTGECSLQNISHFVQCHRFSTTFFMTFRYGLESLCWNLCRTSSNSSCWTISTP